MKTEAKGWQKGRDPPFSPPYLSPPPHQSAFHSKLPLSGLPSIAVESSQPMTLPGDGMCFVASGFVFFLKLLPTTLPEPFLCMLYLFIFPKEQILLLIH